MKTFREFFIESNQKRKRKRSKKRPELSIARGHEFGTAGAGKAGLMQADKKEFRKKKQRKEGKDQARNAMREDY